jgi:hypothetical protein
MRETLPEKYRDAMESLGYRFYPHGHASCVGLWQKRILSGEETLYFIDIFVHNFNLEFDHAPNRFSFYIECHMDFKNYTELMVKTAIGEEDFSVIKLKELEALCLEVYKKNDVISYSAGHD